MQELPNLQLKQRIAHISTCLHQSIDSDYITTLSILLQSMPPELDTTKTDDDFGDFIFAPFSHYVATYGCTEEHLAQSLDALKDMTKRFSAEFSIRNFLNEFPEETLDFLKTCASDENYHVRRLASEGSRPKLPWGSKLVSIEYKDTLPILDALYNDPTRYVTRLVANHLHDISKLDPDFVLATLAKWKRQSPCEETDFVCRHSLRTLVKQKHKGALRLLGFRKPQIHLEGLLTSTPRVILGQAFEFSVHIKSLARQQLVLDYVMEFATAKPSSKVFKLKKVDATKGQNLVLRKRHPMRIMTTRKLVPGKHKITLQVNGDSVGSVQFHLVAAKKTTQSKSQTR